MQFQKIIQKIIGSKLLRQQYSFASEIPPYTSTFSVLNVEKGVNINDLIYIFQSKKIASRSKFEEAVYA